MPAPVPVTCPRCGHQALLKDPARLGETRPCRECGEPFALRADPAGGDDGFGGEFGTGRPADRAAAGPSCLRRALLTAGGGLAALALLVGAVWAMTAWLEQQERARNARDAANRRAAAAPAAAVPAASEAEARRLGERVAAALDAGDADALADLLDYDAAVDRALDGFDLGGDFAQGVEKGLRDGEAAFVRDLTDNTLSARSLGVSDYPGSPAGSVRILTTDGGANYLLVLPGPDGRATDWFNFITGERFSVTLRRLTGPALAGSAAARAAAVKLKDLGEAAVADPVKALRLYESMPESFKQVPAVQAYRLAAVAGTDDPDDDAAAYADLDRRFPEDPSVDLLRIDGLTGDPEALIAACLRLSDAVGGDPWLRGLAAQYLPDVGRAGEALELAVAAEAAEPGLEQVRWGLLGAHLGVGDHPAAADDLRFLRDELGIADLDPQSLVGLYVGAEEFLESDAFAAFAAETDEVADD